VRVALIGSGWIQDFHARGVVAYPGAELVAVANHREKSARALAERYGISPVTTDWRSLTDRDDLDAVVVATPNTLHAEQSIAFLEAGKHVLVEKPMAVSVAECDAMIDAAARGGASLMVAHCWRFRDEVIAMRGRIASGELGEIVKTRGYGVHEAWGPKGWFVDRELAGGGALVDMGVHAIDTARFVLGGPLPERVCAAVETRYGTYDVDDDAILLVGWSNGTNSVIESGWWHPHKEGMEADTEVYGTKGYARIFPREEPSADHDHVSQPMFTEQMREFLGAIEQGRAPHPSGEDGRIVMQVVERAYASAAGGGHDA
jgi:predicted dehydrogenase